MADIVEPHSPTWRAVKTRAKERLEADQRKLEAAGTDLARTEHLRGRIAAFREILRLEDGAQS